MSEKKKRTEEQNKDVYGKLLEKAKKDCAVQLQSIRDHLKKHIHHEKELAFIYGMIETQIELSTRIVTAETALQSANEMLKDVHRLVDAIMATKLQINLDYVNTEAADEDECGDR